MRSKTLKDDNHCVGCHTDLSYEVDGKKYSRVIGVQYMPGSAEAFDGVSEWMCPSCGRREGRFTGRVLGEGELEPRYGGK